MKKTGLIMMIIGLIGMIFTAKSFFTYTTFDDRKTYVSENIEEIVVISHYANVSVLPSESEDIEIQLQGERQRKITPLVSLNQQTGKLQIDLNQTWFTNISFFGSGFNMRDRLNIYLPNKQFESIRIKNEVGKTVVQNIFVDHLKINNSVANVHIEHVQANKIDVKNYVGQIVLKHSTGKVFAENDVGGISITVDDINHDMELVSNVGKIFMFVSNIPQHTSFIANTSLGHVKIFGEREDYIHKDAIHLISMTTDIGQISVQER